MGSRETVLKRKRSEISDFSIEESSDSSSFRLSDMKRWKKGAYNTIYLILLDEAISDNFAFAGRQYKLEFWDAFTTELNDRIRKSLPDGAQLQGFTTWNVIHYGRFLRSTYHDFKGEPHKLENFAYFDRCFKRCERCTHIPMFPSHETYSGNKRSNSCSSTSSCKRGSGATTSGNSHISRRLSYLQNIGRLNVQKLIKALEYFCNEEDINSQTWLLLSEDSQEDYNDIIGGCNIYA